MCVCRWVRAEGVCVFTDVCICESVQRSSESLCEALRVAEVTCVRLRRCREGRVDLRVGLCVV